jgi:hypothetical protein
MMDAQDWRDMAKVYWAGAQQARTWSHNTGMQQQARILEAMTTECETNAWRLSGRLSGESRGPLEHDQLHRHADGTVHRHPHEHPAIPGDPEDHDHVHPPDPEGDLEDRFRWRKA